MNTKHLFALAFYSFVLSAFGQGTSFTYQGKLSGTNGPVSGFYDFRFIIRDAATTNGTPIGPTLTLAGVTVSNGLFSVVLDPGAAVFTGAPRWLEIDVKTNGASSYEVLEPLQEITATPYAIMAGSAPFAGVSGLPLYIGANTVGSLGNQPLDLFVNGQRGLQLATTRSNDSINVLAGSPYNYVASNLISVTIAGGGLLSFNGGQTTNAVASDFGTVGGGAGNHIGTNSNSGVISGGYQNLIDHNTFDGTIGGGSFNRMGTNSDTSTIGGGSGNIISSDAHYSTIGGGAGQRIYGTTNYNGGFPTVGTIAGGYGNVINSNTPFATIGGGLYNTAGGNSSTIGGGYANTTLGYVSTVAGGYVNYSAGDYAVVGGGYNNNIASNINVGTISGGVNNAIRSNANYSTISGGGSNLIDTNAIESTIGGGSSNQILTNSFRSVIGGGSQHSIQTNSDTSTIAGGRDNVIHSSALRSVVGGGQANVIQTNAHSSTISGGRNHSIGTNADHSTIGGGQQNSIQQWSYQSTIGGGAVSTIRSNSQYATISGGGFNVIEGYGTYGTIGGGNGNALQYTAYAATIGGGEQNIVATNAAYATVPGGTFAKANNYGQMAYASGRFAATGDAQGSTYILRGLTTGASGVELFLDGSFRRMTIPANTTWTYDILISAQSSTGASGAYQIKGAIRNFSGTTSSVGSPTVTIVGEDRATWDAYVIADSGSAALRVIAVGEEFFNVRWVANVRTSEVSY